MANSITGEVTDFGESGNLITNIQCEQLADVPRDVTTSIRFDGHETNCLYEADHDEPESTMVAYLGKSGFLEIEIVGMNLAEMLGITKGSSVSVNW